MITNIPMQISIKIGTNIYSNQYTYESKILTGFPKWIYHRLADEDYTEEDEAYYLRALELFIEHFDEIAYYKRRYKCKERIQKLDKVTEKVLDEGSYQYFEAKGYHRSNIRDCCMQKPHMLSHKGYKWRYASPRKRIDKKYKPHKNDALITS